MTMNYLPTYLGATTPHVRRAVICMLRPFARSLARARTFVHPQLDWILIQKEYIRCGVRVHCALSSRRQSVARAPIGHSMNHFFFLFIIGDSIISSFVISAGKTYLLPPGNRNISPKRFDSIEDRADVVSWPSLPLGSRPPKIRVPNQDEVRSSVGVVVDVAFGVVLCLICYRIN